MARTRAGPLIKVICKARTVQAHSLAGPARLVPLALSQDSKLLHLTQATNGMTTFFSSSTSSKMATKFCHNGFLEASFSFEQF